MEKVKDVRELRALLAVPADDDAGRRRGTVAAMNSGEKSATAPGILEKWDKDFDVIIAGSGAAGLAAAIEAADNNASVIVLEKTATIGGNSLLSGGNYGSYGTDRQREKGSSDPRFRDDTADLYYREKRALGDYRSNPALARIFADNSLAGYNWLKSLGMEYHTVDMYQQMGLHPDDAGGAKKDGTSALFKNGAGDNVLTKGRHHRDGKYKRFKDGSALVHCLLDAARSRGIEIVTRMEIVEIIREQGIAGEVLGVAVKDHNTSKKLVFRANKAMILAAGGFSANAGMCKKSDQRIHPKVRNTGMKGVTGELLIAAQDIGADTMNMDFVQIRMGKSAFGYHHKVMASKVGTYIDVDPQGRRFWKEMSDNKTVVRSERLSQVHARDMHIWYAITDSEGIKANRITDEEIQKNLKLRRLFSADTVEKLAREIGLPAKNLAGTVDRYNSLVKRGRDEDFGQHNKSFKWQIAVPPFFAMPKTYYTHVTLGGVCINESAQVIDRRGNIIPRLYAAGEFTGGIHGLERNGGCGITECIVYGRIAGQRAAGEKRSKKRRR